MEPCKGSAARLVLTAELLVWDVCGQVGVQQGAEGQAVVPTAAEVGDVDVLERGAAIKRCRAILETLFS